MLSDTDFNSTDLRRRVEIHNITYMVMLQDKNSCPVIYSHLTISFFFALGNLTTCLFWYKITSSLCRIRQISLYCNCIRLYKCLIKNQIYNTYVSILLISKEYFFIGKLKNSFNKRPTGLSDQKGSHLHINSSSIV